MHTTHNEKSYINISKLNLFKKGFFVVNFNGQICIISSHTFLATSSWKTWSLRFSAGNYSTRFSLQIFQLRKKIYLQVIYLKDVQVSNCEKFSSGYLYLHSIYLHTVQASLSLDYFEWRYISFQRFHQGSVETQEEGGWLSSGRAVGQSYVAGCEQGQGVLPQIHPTTQTQHIQPTRSQRNIFIMFKLTKIN